ncbi:tumor necrosis factor receptor superfamily member 5 isoform X4 [Micropterus salmoides]|nr:tumor necrosis factor receptor superfamily member 5 isoform X4 [Micropterus salmoides]XP_038567070.1 tumor necrosis factor receptor superfamily member 5 isoform X4 [Micropterus salmoides]XP_038567071.1 tumor necrosis factor receptor superfamily member 5 isoform X4 [Micropterus salmoides]
MGLVQCFVIVLMLSAQWVLSSPVTDGIRFYTMYGRRCQMCPAGEYEKSCNECERCPAGTYTTDWNRENDCHRCYGDCRPDLHLKVSQNCTSKSDVKCICEAGYRCTATVPYTTNCRDCAKIQETTTTEVAAVTSDKGKHTASSTSSGQSSSSSKPCTFPECGPRSVPKSTTGPHLETDKTRSQLAAILCPVVAMGCMALVILFFVRRPGDESCFKQAIAKLRNKGGRDASHKLKESTHQFSIDSSSAKQQSSSVSAANLGPVHVHNPGTVIFSLLSQFTGQVGPTIEGGKMAQRGNSEEEDERDCPVFHPTSSPSIHLSEEERSGEIDSIFFPSQEQGKDCHVSKEEAL